MLDGSQTSLTFQTTHRHKNGTNIPVEIVLQYIAPEGDNPRFVTIVRDITERKKPEKILANQAIRDSLTGLYNRRCFDQRISEELLKLIVKEKHWPSY